MKYVPFVACEGRHLVIVFKLRKAYAARFLQLFSGLELLFGQALDYSASEGDIAQVRVALDVTHLHSVEAPEDKYDGSGGCYYAEGG